MSKSHPQISTTISLNKYFTNCCFNLGVIEGLNASTRFSTESQFCHSGEHLKGGERDSKQN